MLTATNEELKFEIVEDYPEVGAYLYVYENDQCIRDDLQDSVAICQEVALEDYGVPLDCWKHIDSRPSGREETLE